MKVRNHFLMLGVLLGAVSALRLGTASHFNRQFQAVGKEAAQKHSRQIEAAWKRHAYSDLASAHTEQAILSKIPWPSLALSEVQQAKLRLRVQEVLRYLEQPSFDEYYRLKTEGLHWSLEPQGYASSLLGMSTQHRTTVSPSDEPKGAVRFMWENAGASEKPSPPKLAAVCVDTLTGSTGRTNTGRALLTGSVILFGNLAGFGFLRGTAGRGRGRLRGSGRCLGVRRSRGSRLRRSTAGRGRGRLRGSGRRLSVRRSRGSRLRFCLGECRQA